MGSVEETRFVVTNDVENWDVVLLEYKLASDKKISELSDLWQRYVAIAIIVAMVSNHKTLAFVDAPTRWVQP